MSVAIVGAIEATPGWMTVSYFKHGELDRLDGEIDIEMIHVPTKVYLDCWDNPANVIDGE